MPLRTIGIAGLGLLGRGIAACFVAHGFRVVAFTRRQETHESARHYITQAVEDLVSRAGFPAELSAAWRDWYVPVDAWDLDAVLTGSQKGWMVPPGMAMVSVSERGWKAIEQARIPRYYFDYGKAKSYLEKGQTPWTPAVSVYYAMDVALQKLEAEGLPAIHERHARLGQFTRDGVKALGMKLLAVDERYASNTVTAVWVPEGVDQSALSKMMRTEYNTVLAGGQGSLTGKIIRIGHLGLVTQEDLQACLDALKLALPRLGFSPVAAAR